MKAWSGVPLDRLDLTVADLLDLAAEGDERLRDRLEPFARLDPRALRTEERGRPREVRLALYPNLLDESAIDEPGPERLLERVVGLVALGVDRGGVGVPGGEHLADEPHLLADLDVTLHRRVRGVPRGTGDLRERFLDRAHAPPSARRAGEDEEAGRGESEDETGRDAHGAVRGAPRVAAVAG